MAYIARIGATNFPDITGTVKVYETGTTNLVSGLIKLDGVTSLSNPFTVSDAIASSNNEFWGFNTPTRAQIDIVWDDEGVDRYLVEMAIVKDPKAILPSEFGFIYRSSSEPTLLEVTSFYESLSEIMDVTNLSESNIIWWDTSTLPTTTTTTTTTPGPDYSFVEGFESIPYNKFVNGVGDSGYTLSTEHDTLSNIRGVIANSLFPYKGNQNAYTMVDGYSGITSNIQFANVTEVDGTLYLWAKGEGLFPTYTIAVYVGGVFIGNICEAETNLDYQLFSLYIGEINNEHLNLLISSPFSYYGTSVFIDNIAWLPYVPTTTTTTTTPVPTTTTTPGPTTTTTTTTPGPTTTTTTTTPGPTTTTTPGPTTTTTTTTPGPTTTTVAPEGDLRTIESFESMTAVGQVGDSGYLITETHVGPSPYIPTIETDNPLDGSKNLQMEADAWGDGIDPYESSIIFNNVTQNEGTLKLSYKKIFGQSSIKMYVYINDVVQDVIISDGGSPTYIETELSMPAINGQDLKLRFTATGSSNVRGAIDKIYWVDLVPTTTTTPGPTTTTTTTTPGPTTTTTPGPTTTTTTTTPGPTTTPSPSDFFEGFESMSTMGDIGDSGFVISHASGDPITINTTEARTGSNCIQLAPDGYENGTTLFKIETGDLITNGNGALTFYMKKTSGDPAGNNPNISIGDIRTASFPTAIITAPSFDSTYRLVTVENIPDISSYILITIYVNWDEWFILYIDDINWYSGGL